MSEKPAIRTPSGTFAPGVSGNPTGRPRIPNKIREMAKAYTEQATRVLVDALDATRVVGLAAIEVPDHQVRIMAAQAILDRGWGKPCSVNEMPKDEDESVSQMSDADLLREAVERAKAIGDGN